MDRKKYQKKPGQLVTAVQINLETKGLCYTKWGGEQRCKAKDWLVNNNGECYTVEEESFAKTYTEIAPGQYIKTGAIWAEQVEQAGSVKTKEGRSHYQAGDYLVSNNEDGTDAYTIPRALFEENYEQVEK